MFISDNWISSLESLSQRQFQWSRTRVSFRFWKPQNKITPEQIFFLKNPRIFKKYPRIEPKSRKTLEQENPRIDFFPENPRIFSSGSVVSPEQWYTVENSSASYPASSSKRAVLIPVPASVEFIITIPPLVADRRLTRGGIVINFFSQNLEIPQIFSAPAAGSFKRPNFRSFQSLLYSSPAQFQQK